MSTKPEITREEAQKWVDSREWANGWNANADKSIDAVEFATQYKLNKPLWDKLFKYLAETRPHDPCTGQNRAGGRQAMD